MLVGCSSTPTSSNSTLQKQTTQTNTSELLNDVESEDVDNDYAPEYTQVWECKDKNFSFKFACKYGFKESFPANVTGKYYETEIEIFNTWEPKGKYDGKMSVSTDRGKDKLYNLFDGEYKLSENDDSLTFVVRKVYKNKIDKHGVKKNDKIVFTKVSGPKAQSHENDDKKTNSDFAYTYNSDTKTLTFSGKGIIRQGIEDDAWTRIKNPKNIVVDSGVTGIGDFAFYAIDEDKEIAGEVAARNYFCNIEDIKLSDTVSKIGTNAFYGCKSLKGIKIPSKVELISESAFNSCSSLCSVTMGDNVEKIDSYAFCNCKKLSTIIMPNNLKIIGYKAFENCVELSDIKLSASIKSIASDAFIGCKNLKEITVPQSIIKIGIKALGYADEREKVDEFTINGYKGTAAEKYAKDNGFKFVALD